MAVLIILRSLPLASTPEVPPFPTGLPVLLLDKLLVLLDMFSSHALVSSLGIML
jgi:hypothetical protein